MREINIMSMKINEVETRSSVTLGRSMIDSITLVSVKVNQSFGHDYSDGSIHIRSIGKIHDADVLDAVTLHEYKRI